MKSDHKPGLTIRCIRQKIFQSIGVFTRLYRNNGKDGNGKNRKPPKNLPSVSAFFH
jgi:hypothetical protein